MRIIKASKYHKCKNCCDIYPGDYYYPQRRNKAICLECGKNKSYNERDENKKILIFIALMIFICFCLTV